MKNAFIAIPRHHFIRHFSPDGKNWITLTPENLHSFFPLLYEDTTLLLYSDSGDTCTISQPTLVLKMLEQLDLRPGHKVFELGAGSAWNAAMLGHIVGKDGLVMSLEIIPQMAKEAQDKLARFDLPQVKIIQGDGNNGYPEAAPFDRGVFTAGAYDIPNVFYDQIKDEGKLLFVLKTPHCGDLLLSLRKTDGHFEELERFHVSFVPVTGPQAPNAINELNQLINVHDLRIYPRRGYRTAEKKNIILGSQSVFEFQA